MFGPTTYWVSWRSSFQGQVGGFVWQFPILLGLYWATSGLCSALQHIGSVGGLYVGLILAQVAILGHFRLCWAYLGSCAGVLGHLEGYVEILEGYKAICGYFEPSVLELERSVCLRPFFLHGSSIFEFLVLCCMQPLGCVMCKKHCKYREIVKHSEQCRSIFSTPTGEQRIKIHLGCILGLSCVISGSSWGFCLAIYDFVGLILGPLRAYVRPYNILGQLEGYMLGLSWPKWPYWVISRLCWAYLGPVQAYWATWRAMLRSWRAIRPYAAAISSQVC